MKNYGVLSRDVENGGTSTARTKEITEGLRHTAEIAVRNAVSRDAFFDIMHITHGFDHASYALECYDEISKFIISTEE